VYSICEAAMKFTREQIQTDHTEASYSPTLHAATCALSAVATIGVSLWQLSNVAPWHWLAFAGTIVLNNAGEYGLHRGPFHHPVKGPAKWLYFKHTTMHHSVYDHDTMAMDDARDLKWILLPAWGFASTLAVMTPVIGALYWINPNLGWMYLLAQGTYYAVYEVLHTASHLPEGHWLTQNRLVKWVSRHHRVHHDPRLMGKYNFNFALPLFDWLLGTLYRERHAIDGELPDDAGLERG
jgi:hypothetical protein